MTITLDQAKGLTTGTILHHVSEINADGTPQRWRVNGKVQRWKGDTDRIKIPMKRGLYEFGYLTNDNLDLVSLP